MSDIEKSIYPFGEIKLNRADVEWLLATHESGLGPVDPSKRYILGHARGLDLRGADLCNVNLSGMPLIQLRAGLRNVEWHRATVEQREKAATHLEGASLYRSDLRWSTLRSTHLEGADLRLANLEGSTFRGAHLEGADLRLTFFDHKTVFHDAILGDRKHGFVSLADVSWNGVNLAVLDWASVKMLGDEQALHKGALIEEFRIAVRANRQLAVALQTQGLNEEASYFAYRAQKIQRAVSRRQKRFGQYFFSLFLDLLAGYGYRPGRSVLWYLAVIFGFALAYFAIGHLPFFPDAFVFSLTSFHGRGFFPGLGNENSLHNPLVVIAAFEAVIGLLIEISFIATFTQRFFGR